MRVLLAAIGIAVSVLAHGQSIPDSAYERTLKTAYLYQENPRYGKEGRMYCAPVSTAMQFSWLAENGFPNLLPKGESKIDSLQKSVMLLASYMGTTMETGTNTTEVIMGVLRYVQDAGYNVTDVEYAGWRKPAKGVPGTIVSKTPNFDLLRWAVNQPTTLTLMNVAPYTQVQDGVWVRGFGHWVAIVGYGTDGTKADKSIVLLHNPSIGTPKGITEAAGLTNRLTPDLARISTMEGTIVSNSGKVLVAKGPLYPIEGPALPKTKRGDATFIDGIVTFTLGAAKPN